MPFNTSVNTATIYSWHPVHCCLKILYSKWATIMNCAFVMPVANSQHQPRTILLSRPSHLSCGGHHRAFYLWPDSPALLEMSTLWTLGPKHIPWTGCRRKFDLWCPCFQDNFILPFLTCPSLVIYAALLYGRRPSLPGGLWSGLDRGYYSTIPIWPIKKLSLWVQWHYSWVAVQGLNPSTSAPHHCLNSLPALMDKRPTQCWKQELTCL